jgi:type I restriction enzyme, S subunit
VLKDADALIESLERLLAKKRRIKQGAMEELLTGKTRLPGFTGEWISKGLGDLIHSCSSGATPYRGRTDFYKGNIKWITSGELNYNLITDTFEHISEEAVERTNLRVHPVGTFLVAITGLEAEGTRGACGIVGSPATTNQSCMAIYPTADLTTQYLYHYYVFRGKELALKYCQGTKQQSYTAALIKLLPINVPTTTDEQLAIASVLSEMDIEIDQLTFKLTKVRQIKQGMMEELLTGRIRLIHQPAEVIPFAAKSATEPTQGASHNAHFNEAVVLAALASRFGSDRFPLGRFRRTKLSYLLHRYAKRETTGFLKKAAGPYNPSTRYGGAEKIALQRGYVRVYNSGKAEGFIAGEKSAQAQEYFEKWYGSHVVTWLEQFRYKTNNEMELLTTIDMACEDLQRESKDVNPRAVKQILGDHPEWKAKLDKPIFSDKNIASAIEECQKLFSGDNQTL